MEINETIDLVEREFARYGFPECPLSRDGIKKLLIAGTSRKDIYDFGCDVAAGYYDLIDGEYVEREDCGGLLG
jgi:hypothetical protein